MYHVCLYACLLLSPVTCITTLTYQLVREDVSPPSTAPKLSGITLADCGVVCARNTDCHGFTSNKARAECQLLLADDVSAIVFTAEPGTNLYLNTSVQCLINQDCSHHGQGCYQGRCVDKCKPFQVLTSEGTCKTSWKFVAAKEPFGHAFLPWIFINASYLHAFHFDPNCSPSDYCSLLITNQTIPNKMYEVWPPQGNDWPVEEGILFHYQTTGLLGISLIQGSSMEVLTLGELKLGGSLAFSFDIMDNGNKMKVKNGFAEVTIDLTINLDTFWLTTFHEATAQARWFSIEDPDMTNLVGFSTCGWACSMEFSWDMARALRRTVLENPVEADDIIQWYQLPYNKNWVSTSITQFPNMQSPTQYNLHASGLVLFELRLEKDQEIVLHGSEKNNFRNYTANFKARNFQTNFDSVESALKIRFACIFFLPIQL